MTPTQQKSLSTAKIFGIPVFSGSKQQLLADLEAQVEKGRELQVVYTPNPEQIALSFHNPKFAETLSQADINLPDGAGLVWAVNRQPHHQDSEAKMRRIAGREVFHDLLETAKDKGWRVFLLGGRPGAAEKIISKFKSPESSISFDNGTRNISQESPEERRRVLEAIQKFKPELLFVAYGAPWQEFWVRDNREALDKAGVRLAMVVGGALDYEAGLVSRVPAWMASIHLEWLWRLVTEPWRWKRQIRGLEFFWKVLFFLP